MSIHQFTQIFQQGDRYRVLSMDAADENDGIACGWFRTFEEAQECAGHLEWLGRALQDDENTLMKAVIEIALRYGRESLREWGIAA